MQPYSSVVSFQTHRYRLGAFAGQEFATLHIAPDAAHNRSRLLLMGLRAPDADYLVAYGPVERRWWKLTLTYIRRCDFE